MSTLLPYNLGTLLIRIGELRVNSVKFNNNEDGKGKGEVLGLCLARWKGLRGIVLEVVRVMEVGRQLTGVSKYS